MNANEIIGKPWPEAMAIIDDLCAKAQRLEALEAQAGEVFVIMHSYEDWAEGDTHTELCGRTYYETEEAAARVIAENLRQNEEAGDPFYGELYPLKLTKEGTR